MNKIDQISDNYAAGTYTLMGIVRLLVGAHAVWRGCKPERKVRIYFANHSSHLDVLTIWASMPAWVRGGLSAVAAKEYWEKSWLRRYIAKRILNAVLIKRESSDRTEDRLELLEAALKSGRSLILFPEGTRNAGDIPETFKSGLYHLAKRNPSVELVPVYLENTYRSMPKGKWIPLPLNCNVYVGAPIFLKDCETRLEFLTRAREAVIQLSL
jgi:1-acyl-sn-glycerol-3-phosphate acyltransferase